MRSILLKIIRFSYLVIAKPILVLFLPDKVHESIIEMSIWIGSKKYFRKFMRKVFIGKRDKRLEQKFFGIDFKSPIGLGAGFDKNGEIIPAISSIGFGFSVIGSVTSKPCTGNPRPWFYRLPNTQSLVINVGFANHGSDIILKRINEYNSGIVYKFPIVVSVAQTNSSEVTNEKKGIADYIDTIKKAKNTKNIKMIELNVSCPNAFGGVRFDTPDRLSNLLTEVDKIKTTKPIFIKLSADLLWKQTKPLLDVIVKHRVEGVVLSYLAVNRLNIQLEDELSNKIPGSLSGKPIRWLSNELIRRTFKNYGDRLMVIGVGGVFSAEDAYAKIKFGASLVELVTGTIINGPQLAAEINEGILKLLEKDGYSHISQAIGVDVIDYLGE